MIKPNQDQKLWNPPDAPPKVVKLDKKSKSIYFWDYLFKPKKDTDFTTLTKPQQEAIKAIEKYWKNRVHNSKNWKWGNHWSYKKESLSARVESEVFEQLKYNINQRCIQNFVRHFLRNKPFRDEFYHKLLDQYHQDAHSKILAFDITDWLDILKELFPCVISGQIYKLEKDLFSFYCKFKTDFSMSYTTRVALMHFRDMNKEGPIERDEVTEIMVDILYDPERNAYALREF